ncbi:Peptidyl-tRNA hydrolase-like protein [Venustampulla echinocandica]|uniref:peptidyl-tRNA hydrolase n=1 Tax=Venustampulla echinocandica TaxID=2656787 RepID=A0A370TJA6_9HELO|nr:Peptidyl-tRNA hydrolase-like protein [Venustampulla echinocandica]RDL35422.1 Peptidyl-tRNA hydrolase-like protein [Venustampulla echinocandica]
MAQPSELESVSQRAASTPKENTRRSKHQEKRNAPIDDSGDGYVCAEGSSIATTPTLNFLSIHQIAQMATPLRLLVCSIGNPAPYTNTFHSAGHNVISALASSLAYPGFQKVREYGNGAVSAGADFTLWQSRSLMNVSGTGVAAAWKQFIKETRGEDAALVVVHDELELAIGDVKVRDGGASAKGHNGLKDIAKCLRGQKYKRIAVGIGRPESREPNVVAGYVLRKMSGAEKAKIETAATKVEAELRRMKGI